MLDRNRNRNIHFEVEQRFGQNVQINPSFLVLLAPSLSPQHYLEKELEKLEYDEETEAISSLIEDHNPQSYPRSSL